MGMRNQEIRNEDENNNKDKRSKTSINRIK